MNTVKLAIIGFGNVGQGLVKILKERGDFLAEHFAVQFSVVAVCDLKLGSVYDPGEHL